MPSSKSHPLYLFAQLPLYAKFRYETPDQGQVYVKTSETHAHPDRLPFDGTGYKQVSPNILVFPIADEIPWEEVISPEQGADADLGEKIWDERWE